MAHYLQRERYLDIEIPNGGIVNFDLLITESSSIDDSELEPVTLPDFYHHIDGEFMGAIDILKRGDYLIMWGLDQQTDRPLTTEFVQLRQWVESPISPRWESIGGVSTHLKATATVGFAILNKTDDNVTTVALFNESGESIHLNNFGDSDGVLCQKARIIFFGLSEDDGDFSRIMELIELEACCYPIDELMDRIRKLTLREEDQYHRIEDLQVKFLELSNDYQFLSSPPVLVRWPFTISSPDVRGMHLCCKRVGYMYYLWVEGESNNGFTLNPSIQEGYRVMPAVDMKMPNEKGETSTPFLSNFPYDTAVYGLCWVYDSTGETSTYSEYQFRIEPPRVAGINDNQSGLWIRSTANQQKKYMRISVAISLAPDKSTAP